MSSADFGRVIHIAKQRERTKEDIEKAKQELEEERRRLENRITSKFTNHVDKVEEQLKAETVGLVTLDKLKEKQKDITGKAEESSSAAEGKSRDQKSASPAPREKVQKRVLSFGDEEEEEEEFVPKRAARLGMDPTVDTSFLPDHDREKELERKKEELAREWKEKNEKEKNEEINVAYSYWDGSNHRKDMKVKKGATISQFLQRALEIMRKEFSELKTANTENLMFVKEDLIIPHFYTFQDFVATRAMGKTGPLWQFDAAGEIRVRQDAALDIGESHPVKIVLRHWFEKNKHIYPASRWEAFVPNKEYKRTIDDLSTI